jgi:hypothetical protein
VVYRPPTGDQVLTSISTHFDEPTGPSQFDAQPFDADADLAAVPAQKGDLLVLRFSASGTGTGTAYIPNSDGARANGRIPSITLPH